MILQKPGVMTFLAVSEKMVRIREAARKLAEVGDPILVVGEVGTGKEHLARWIAYLRGDQETWVRVDGQQTSHEELSRFFEQFPPRGTWFFHRVDEMPQDLHPWVFRALETPSIRVIGSAMPVFLQTAEQDPAMRQLFYRFVHTLEIPPLRERVEEIPHFVRYFLNKWDVPDMGVAPEVLRIFELYPWPGNLLELRNILYQLVLAHRDEKIIRPEHLPSWFTRRVPLPPGGL